MVTDTLMGKMGYTSILSKCPSKRKKVPLTKMVTMTVRVNEATVVIHLISGHYHSNLVSLIFLS